MAAQHDRERLGGIRRDGLDRVDRSTRRGAVRASAALHSRPSDPDRPDVTNGTHIVDTGLLQIEFGGLFTSPGAAQSAFATPFTARLGVFEWLEARIGADGLVTQSNGGARASGYGNTQLGAKLRLWADPGGVPVLSVLPTVNLPTADSGRGLGSGKADFSLVLLTGTDLGRHTHADVNYGIAAIGEETLTRTLPSTSCRSR